MTTASRPALLLLLSLVSIGACDDGSGGSDTGAGGATDTLDTATDGDDTGTATSPGSASSADDGGDDGNAPTGTTANADDGGDGADDGTTDDGTDDGSGDGGGATGDVDEPPPQGDAALRPWLEAGSYLGWAAESGVHVSAGPHGMGVRTFVNDVLLASLDAGSPEHEVGAAVVKELYDANGLSGWAVMRKLEPGQAGDGWYWYETVGDAIYADDTGVALCTGCHAMGTDYVRTPYPLQ